MISLIFSPWISVATIGPSLQDNTTSIQYNYYFNSEPVESVTISQYLVYF